MKTTLNIDETVMRRLWEEAARRRSTNEILRTGTHRRVFRSPWTRVMRVPSSRPCWTRRGSRSCFRPVATRLSLEQTVAELPDVLGNQEYALHTAVRMRAHGVGRICTRHTGFHRFPFLDVVDPVR